MEFEQFLLTWIWRTSLGMSVLACCFLYMLILRRHHSAKQQAAGELRRGELVEIFHAALRSPVQLDSVDLPVLQGGDERIVVSIALDTMRAIQGNTSARIVTLLRVWGLGSYLEKAVTDGSRGASIQALTLMAHFDDDGTLHHLVTQARSKDPYIQLAALRGLANRAQGQLVFDSIVRLRDSNQTNMLMLADVLKKFGDPAVPALHVLAEGAQDKTAFTGTKRENQSARVAAIMALGAIGNSVSVPFLIPFLDDPDAEIRSRTVAALGDFGDPAAGNKIASLMNDTETGVRVQSAKALGKIRADSTLPKLVEGLQDQAWWVRFRSAQAIFGFGDRGIVLLRVAASGDDVAAGIALQVLAEMGGEK